MYVKNNKLSSTSILYEPLVFQNKKKRTPLVLSYLLILFIKIFNLFL